MTIKKPITVLCLLWLSLAVQGCESCCFLCSPVTKSSVTITIEGQPTTLHFANLGIHENAKHLREVLEKLERGEPVDVNQPNECGEIPLAMAVHYALSDRYCFSHQDARDENFYAARYLLMHGADVNAKAHPFGHESTAAHELCATLRGKEEVGIRGLVLLLSYGAKLDIQDKHHKSDVKPKTPIDYLEKAEPWIPEALREQYEKKDKSEESKSKPLHPEEKSTQPPAWKAHVTLSEQRSLKQQYWTQVVQALLQAQQHKPLHAAFVDYVAQAGVEAGLVQQLQDRT